MCLKTHADFCYNEKEVERPVYILLYETVHCSLYDRTMLQSQSTM